MKKKTKPSVELFCYWKKLKDLTFYENSEDSVKWNSCLVNLVYSKFTDLWTFSSDQLYLEVDLK